MVAYRRRLSRSWPGLWWGGAAVAVGAFLGLLALRFSPMLAIGAVVGSALLVAIARAPEIGLLAIVLLSVGFFAPDSLPQIPFGPFDLNLAEVILLFQLAHVAAEALTSQKAVFIGTPLSGYLGWFLSAVLFSAARAVLVYATDLFFVISRMRVLLFYAAFFVVIGLISTRRQVRRLVGGLDAIAIVLALAALAQALLPTFRLPGGQAGTLATAGQWHEGVLRVTLPGLLLIYIMLVVSICDLALQHGARGLPTLLRALTLGAGVVLAFQRNYWLTLGLVFGAILALVGSRPRLRILRAATVSALVVWLTVSYAGGDIARYTIATRDRLLWGLSSHTLVRDRSAQMRLLEGRYALKSVAQHPLLGIGIGGLYRPAVPEDDYWLEMSGRTLRYYVHNAYLWIATKTGIFGLAPLVAFLGLAVARGLGRWRALGDPWERGLVLGITLALAGQVVSNLVTPNLVEAPALVVYPIVIGLTEVILRGNAGGAGIDRRPPHGAASRAPISRETNA